MIKQLIIQSIIKLNNYNKVLISLTFLCFSHQRSKNQDSAAASNRKSKMAGSLSV